jgi:tRNA-dihydrouridine synthase 3
MIPILTPRTALQVAGGQPEHISKIAKLLENETSSDFVDLNCGCPLDTICNR